MPRYQEWLAADELHRMRISVANLRDNPHISAFHFHRRQQLFVKLLLGGKFNLVEHWDRLEWQGRGSPHSHGLYWFLGAHLPDMSSEESRETFAKFWGIHVHALNPETNRQMPVGEANPLRAIPGLEDEPTFLLLSMVIYSLITIVAQANSNITDTQPGTAPPLQ